jgi:putative oxidoreductase
MQAPPSDLVNRPQSQRQHSNKTLAVWLLTLLTSALFIAASLPKLAGFGFFETAFARWGYPGWLELMVGIVEFVGAVFLIIPTTAFFAAMALSAVMVGAIITHLALGHPVLAILPFMVLGILMFLAWVRRPSAARTEQPEPTSSGRVTSS